MQEDFLHYVWKMKLFSMSLLETTEGEPLMIFHPGDHSQHSGPDFTNAKIKIGDTVWAGNVEIHVFSSEWIQHKHQDDRAYDNVILHVVYENDKQIGNIPTLELKNIIREGIEDKYAFMMQTSSWIPCERSIKNVNDLAVSSWLSRLLAERIESKAIKFEQRLSLNQNNWEETCYQLIARNFGTNVNADPFERVTRSLPYNIVRKHLNQPMQVEAMLFGQAGFLEAHFREVYPNQLQTEYKFLQKKYSLEPIRALEWKFLRMRPANFPTFRMSQFANFISQHDILFSKFLSMTNVKEFRQIFHSHAGEYWREHYHFKKSAPVKSTMIGKQTVDLILMNTISPMLYLYGKLNGEQNHISRAVDLTESLAAEKNAIISNWIRLGIKPKHAGDSQALMELKENYCRFKRCLECNIGHQVLKTGA